MSDNFNPQTPFEVYTFMKLEAMSSRLDALPCKAQDERIRGVEQKISNIEGKSSLFGAIFGFIAGIIGKIFMGK